MKGWYSVRDSSPRLVPPFKGSPRLVVLSSNPDIVDRNADIDQETKIPFERGSEASGPWKRGFELWGVTPRRRLPLKGGLS